MQINIKLDPGAMMPIKAHEHDAGFDLYAVKVIDGYYRVNIHTGVHVQIPPGYVGLLCERSSSMDIGVSLKNKIGVIDAGYTGEIIIRSEKSTLRIPHPGDKVAQLVMLPIPQVELVQVDSLDDTERGSNGFGSSDL